MPAEPHSAVMRCMTEPPNEVMGCHWISAFSRGAFFKTHRFATVHLGTTLLAPAQAGAICPSASVCVPAVGAIHLGWAVLYSGRWACYICLRSGCGSDGTVYHVFRGTRDFWKSFPLGKQIKKNNLPEVRLATHAIITGAWMAPRSWHVSYV